MRIATITPGVRDAVIELGLGDWVVCAPDKPGWHPADATPHAAIAPNAPPELIDISSLNRRGSGGQSGHVINVTVDIGAVMRSNPDVILAETECSGCGVRTGPQPHSLGLHGEDPQVVIVHPVGLEDELAWIGPIGTILGVTERASRLQTVRAARLLALRMHVARYLTQTPGARRPTVSVAIYDPDTASWCALSERGKQLVNAAGGLLLAETYAPGAGVVSHADINLVATRGEADAMSDHLGLRRFLADIAPNQSANGSTWSVGPDFMLNARGPGIVMAVETLLRAIFPVALGANGSPPPEPLIRLATGRHDGPQTLSRQNR